jgi:hypothetical protein
MNRNSTNVMVAVLVGAVAASASPLRSFRRMYSAVVARRAGLGLTRFATDPKQGGS